MGKKASAVKVTYRNIKELKPYKKNAKKHPKEQVRLIIGRNGIQDLLEQK